MLEITIDNCYKCDLETSCKATNLELLKLKKKLGLCL